MTILEVPQGYYRANALNGLRADDQQAPWFRRYEVPDTRTAPWGYEWYQVLEDGRLKMHSACYDSSG